MLVYVCSQLRGNPPYSREKIERNLRKAAEYCNEVKAEGNIPIAPHLYFSSFLNDEVPEDREDGMRMGRELLTKCDQIRVFEEEDGISEGMRGEIQLAKDKGIPVVYRERDAARAV